MSLSVKKQRRILNLYVYLGVSNIEISYTCFWLDMDKIAEYDKSVCSLFYIKTEILIHDRLQYV